MKEIWIGLFIEPAVHSIGLRALMGKPRGNYLSHRRLPKNDRPNSNRTILWFSVTTTRACSSLHSPSPPHHKNRNPGSGRGLDGLDANRHRTEGWWSGRRAGASGPAAADESDGHPSPHRPLPVHHDLRLLEGRQAPRSSSVSFPSLPIRSCSLEVDRLFILNLFDQPIELWRVITDSKYSGLELGIAYK